MLVDPNIPGFSQAPILIVTRFSFLGKSGWKSDVSRDPALLFQKNRLQNRLNLFSAITLPSLRAQTDTDFHHLVLTSADLPGWAMEKLQRSCTSAYGGSQCFTIVASSPAPARRPLRMFMEKQFDTPIVAQVVLDDDDGLAVDFVERLRKDLCALETDVNSNLAERPFFISYALGYALVLRSGAPETGSSDPYPVVYRHRYPFINAGLTAVGTPSGKNILSIAHRKAPKRFGHRLFRDSRMFLRTVHDYNDSRVDPEGGWQVVPVPAADLDVAQRFPYLLEL